VSELVHRVEAAIRREHLLKDGQSLLVAVSGGVDSMVLLTVLNRLSKEHRWHLTVAHFNHQLRGRASDADERFVRAAVKRLGLTCVVERGDVRLLARTEKLSIEAAARKLRHEFLARTARDRGAKTIALAHHSDDQVELFFLRLLRGAGSQGLAGMNWLNPSPVDARLVLVRPLLDSTKAGLLAFAREEKIRFREDATNASTDILRNRVRHELLPLLRERYQPAVDAVVLRQMAILRAESELIDGLARDWRMKHGLAFERLPVAVQRRVLQNVLIEEGIDPEFGLIELLRTQPCQPVTVGPGLRIEHDGNGKINKLAAVEKGFGSGQFELDFTTATGHGNFAGLEWNWRTARRAGSRLPKFTEGTEWFDADKVGSAVKLRHWRPGDRFQPAGMDRPVKLQDLFTNRKIPRDARHKLVVAVTSSGEIWWVEGLRISERFKLTPATRRRLKWSWKRGSSPGGA